MCVTCLPACLDFDEKRLAKLKAIADRIKPRGGRVMGERNRKRLDQFDDEAVVRRLLGFPEEELGRALKLENLLRRAKGVERALAISLAIFTGLRVKNLRSLKLDGNIRCSGERVFIHIPEREAKPYRSLDLELPDETITLLDLFVREHRGRLPGSESSYLFPGEDRGPRSYSAMRTTLGRSILKHAGITLSPHLYRHIIAKITVERRPELALDVSRRLGHTSMRTTEAMEAIRSLVKRIEVGQPEAERGACTVTLVGALASVLSFVAANEGREQKGAQTQNGRSFQDGRSVSASSIAHTSLVVAGAGNRRCLPRLRCKFAIS